LANNRYSARARRELKKGGGTRIASVAISCKSTWTKILADQGMLPFWHDGKELTAAQMHAATEKLLAEWCRDWQSQEAEAILSGCKKIRTGALAREPLPDPEVKSWRPTGGGHWSFRTGVKSGKVRQYTKEEREALWNARMDELAEEAQERETSEAEATADIGMRVIGGG
jgi:hypothetical protein